MIRRILKPALVLGPLVAAALLLAAQEGKQMQTATKPICEGAFAIDARGTKMCTFTVTEGMRSPRVGGHFKASGGPRNDIQVWLLDDDSLVNWENHHVPKPIYDSGLVTQGTITAYLHGPGKYHVVFNNKFSLIAPKAVEAQVTLEYKQPPLGSN
jgi:hypothetical protein